MCQRKPYVTRITRHDVDSVVSFLPVGNRDHYEKHTGKPLNLAFHSEVYRDGKLVGWNQTNLQDMQEAEAEGKPYYGRMDIILFDLCDKTCSACGQATSNQRAIYPGCNGTLRGDVDKLSQDDLRWAYVESARCWEVAKKYPCFKKALSR